MIDMFVGLVAKIFKQIDAANQIIPLQVSWCGGSTGVSKQGNGIVTNWIIINIRETSKQWEQRSSCIEVDKLITTNQWRKQEARGAMRGWCAGWVEVEKNVRCPTETGEREKCRTSRVYQLLSNKFLPFVELCILFKFHGATATFDQKFDDLSLQERTQLALNSNTKYRLRVRNSWNRDFSRRTSIPDCSLTKFIAF